MSEKKLKEQFYTLSAVITGFSEFDLRGTGVGETYLAMLKTAAGEANTAELLGLWRRIEECDQGTWDHLLRTKLFSSQKYGPMIRNLVKMWYTGSWSQLPPSWREAYGPFPEDYTHVLSSESYTEGLVWRAAHTHPQGAKQPGFGTWAFPPEQTC